MIVKGCVISCGTVVFFQKSRNLSRSLLTNNNFYGALINIMIMCLKEAIMFHIILIYKGNFQSLFIFYLAPPPWTFWVFNHWMMPIFLITWLWRLPIVFNGTKLKMLPPVLYKYQTVMVNFFSPSHWRIYFYQK